MSTTSMALFSNPLFATYSVYARNASIVDRLTGRVGSRFSWIGSGAESWTRVQLCTSVIVQYAAPEDQWYPRCMILSSVGLKRSAEERCMHLIAGVYSPASAKDLIWSVRTNCGSQEEMIDGWLILTTCDDLLCRKLPSRNKVVVDWYMAV